MTGNPSGITSFMTGKSSGATNPISTTTPAWRSEIEFSVTMPPPGRSEGPGPLRRKQKRVLFLAVTHRPQADTRGHDRATQNFCTVLRLLLSETSQ